ncbi:M20/M25/M40 family metallo-hydrolase [Emticicia sp. TH156]|uniref:M20/M25/M40 family metallo-hydrolase n=1 Tax=Emticicia sp. TH156 TaxID=2067454 RepID=UPI000C77A87B|nr:M20/M25/M40 family metallo-hydrolase [Emticicia sp. TH156]PLK42531.1 aminopeptidase [Emticicia sp. TH156]
MRKRILLLTVVVSVSLFSAFTLPKDELEEVFGKINDDVLNRGRAYETLGEATSSIGHRLTGSPNGKKAEDFAYNLLKEYGFADVKYMPFEVESWARDTVSLAIVPKGSDNFRDVEVVALAHSPVSSHIKGPIVDCGDGVEADFEKVKDQVKGKIALFNINLQSPENKGKKNLHRSEKTALAIKYGAAGVIIANAVEGGVLLTGTASVTGALIPIPAVCVSVESGKQIRKWMNDEPNLLAVIDMQNFSRPIKARNVIATLPGSSKKLKDDKIVIGGHLDSWDLATGAMDNGIGSFTVLDVARVFQALKLKTKRTIEFVMFMGEEQGLLGSKAMVKKYLDEGKLDKVQLMMNLDMVNNARGFNAMGRPELRAFFDEVGNKIRKIDSSYTNTNPNGAGLHSDHQPFMIQGVPVCSPSGSFPVKAYNCYHANCDRFDLIDKKQINNNVRFTAMMLYALANADALPTKKMNDEETKEFLIKQNLKNELIIGKDWRWKE